VVGGARVGGVDGGQRAVGGQQLADADARARRPHPLRQGAERRREPRGRLRLRHR